MATIENSHSRIVSDQLQEQFAALSGDRNPMHMNAAEARRTPAGLPVVHGVHTLLWALAEVPFAGVPSFRIKAKFLKWVYLGEVAEARVTPTATTDEFRIQVEVAGMPVLVAELKFGVTTPVMLDEPLASTPAAPIAQALDLSFQQLHSHSGDSYVASTADVLEMFPQLCRSIGAHSVAEIVACSYVVGMEAPGLHSMFAKFDLTIEATTDEDDRRGALHYTVTHIDERFRKIRIGVTGSRIRGSLEAFVRTPPVQQATMETVADHVQPSEFAGMRALIVGGSRGLGELTAKLIAAGGGVSTITYAVGKSEADGVAEQIRAAGGQVEILPYDVRKPVSPQLAALSCPVTHLFYFATNAIFRSKKELISPPILADFITFYIQGFYDLCQQMTHPGTTYTQANSKLIAYYPSSIAVQERPAGMTEYSMVKAAGELMCEDMNRFMPGLSILSTRLPRLRTDQTTSVLPEREQDSIEILLPILRKMQALRF